MNYTTLTIGEKEYKLRINTRAMCDLEKRIGRNLLDVILDMANNKMPETCELVAILHASLQAYHHGIKFDDVYDIFDEYIADGHTYIEFIEVVSEIFEVSGIIQKEATEEGENPNG